MEYAVFIAVIIAALVGMQFYVKRAVCGRYRQAADVFGSGRQYEPNVTEITKEESKPSKTVKVSSPVKSPETPVGVTAY